MDQKIKEGHALADELEDLLFDTMEGRFFDNDLNMLSAAIQHIDKYADFDDKLPLEYVRLHVYVCCLCMHVSRYDVAWYAAVFRPMGD